MSPPENWICVKCSAALKPGSSGLGATTVVCPLCRQHYPIFLGFPVFTLEPMSLVARHLSLIISQQHQQKIVFSKTASPRAKADIHNLEYPKNLLLRQLAKQPEVSIPENRIFDGAPELGYAGRIIINYVLRDWGTYGTRERQIIVVRVKGAILKAKVKKDSKIVILGCGAAHLVTEVARDFSDVTGVDLSVAGLAMAQDILNGGRYEFHQVFEHEPGQKAHRVQVRAPIDTPTHGKLIVADVCRLPFASGSVDVIVTHYITEILPMPQGLAEEVNRVLKPGGLWINHGVPFVDDLSQFMRQHGFKSGVENFKNIFFMDWQKLSKFASVRPHLTTLTTAKKIKAMNHGDSFQQAVQEFYLGRTKKIASLRPFMRRQFAEQWTQTQEGTKFKYVRRLQWFDDSSGKKDEIVIDLRDQKPKNFGKNSDPRIQLLHQIDGRRSVKSLCQKVANPQVRGELHALLVRLYCLKIIGFK